MSGDANLRFSYHNVRLPNGEVTNPDLDWFIAGSPWLHGPLRLLHRLYGRQLSQKSIADLGALEGGYALEFAKVGMDTLGVEIRQENFANCERLKQAFGLSNLRFVHDDCWNLYRYGQFDAIFCSGLLYHLDRPAEFIKLIGKSARDVAFIHTHFAPETESEAFTLGPLTTNEGMPGRWYHEHDSTDAAEIEAYKLSSFENQNSFWLTRPAILQCLNDAGFDVVLEQHDALGADIIGSMSRGYHKSHHRGLFVGLRSGVR